MVDIRLSSVKLGGEYANAMMPKIDVTSRFRSPTFKKAKKRRMLVRRLFSSVELRTIEDEESLP